MTSRDDPIAARTEALRLEAAEWFARMRREDSERFKPEFESWLADPEHRCAYNRLAARFSDAKILHRSTSDTIGRATRSDRRRATTTLLVATLAVLALALMFVVSSKLPSAGSTIQTARLEGQADAVTRFRLRDGSVVTLDRDALVNVVLDGRERTLRLKHGRARFAVAHEARPFRVDTGTGKVVARGTIFDVAFAHGRTDVALIEGAIDVTSRNSSIGSVRRLQPGQSIALDSGRFDEGPAFAPRAAPDWPRTIVEVRNETLANLLARANRLSVVRLETGDEKLAMTRLSGRFRLDDPAHLGANLARLFDLDLDRHDTRIILSARERQKTSPPD